MHGIYGMIYAIFLPPKIGFSDTSSWFYFQKSLKIFERRRFDLRQAGMVELIHRGVYFWFLQYLLLIYFYLVLLLLTLWLVLMYLLLIPLPSIRLLLIQFYFLFLFLMSFIVFIVFAFDASGSADVFGLSDVSERVEYFLKINRLSIHLLLFYFIVLYCKFIYCWWQECWRYIHIYKY